MGNEPSRLRQWLWDHPLMEVGGSSSDGFLFFKIYGNRFYRASWFQVSVMPVYRALRALYNAKWWLKYRLIRRHRYHLVDTGLSPGYADQDTRMLYACMSLLCDFIGCHGGDLKLEKFSADLRNAPDPSAPEGVQNGQADRQDEAVAIYRWWKVERPADQERRDELLHILYGREDRMSFAPTDHPRLSQIVFKEFEGDEIAMEKEFRRLERKIKDDEQAMLHRLIDIRQSLWT